MPQRCWAFLAGLLLLGPTLACGAETDLTGNWKVTILDQGEQPTLWILHLEPGQGKWTGKVIATRPKQPESTLQDLSITEDRLRFTVKMGDELCSFDARPPKEKTSLIRGSVFVQQHLFPAALEETALQSLDPFDVSKEIVARQATDSRFFSAALQLLLGATEHKAKPEEVRAWADKAYKAADLYGPRWQQDIALKIANALLRQEGYAELALGYARRAERLLDERSPPATQYQVLTVLARALRQADKPDDLKEAEARLDKLDIGPKVEKYAGRKGKSDRAVLVEIFTGAECPPCVGPDLAFDALGKTYKPSEVVLLEYHLHVPGPDPLVNPDDEARAEYYEVSGTPTIVFDGQVPEPQGGPMEAATDFYQAYRAGVNSMLEQPAGAALQLNAVRKGNVIDISADVSEVDKPETVRVRFALVEEEVRYQGGNQLRYQHHVVRALPGGAKGLALTGKTSKLKAQVDLDQLRKELTRYLADYAKANPETPFPNAQRPLELKKLKVAAFVQNDRTKEVLQAAQVDVQAE